MGATLDRSAAIGQWAIAIFVVRARGRPCGAARCAARMGTQTTQAHLHGIECVERETSQQLNLLWLYVFIYSMHDFQ